MNRSLKGVLPVLHMPYDGDLEIDYPVLAREVDWLFATGADGFCLALVSDLLRLTADERMQLPGRLVDMARNRGPVVVSVGAESTTQARVFARAAALGGAAAVMAIPPISRALPEDELQAYFEGILDSVDIPLIIQDASSYVGRAMSIEFQARMHRQHGDRILFKPEATPLGPTISALRAALGPAARIFEGSGGVLLIDSYRRGIDGTIPGVDLLDALVALWRALERGDEARAYAVYLPVCALVTLQLQGGLDGFIVVERHLMHRRGLFPPPVHRGPLGYALDRETREEVDRLYGLVQDVLQQS